MFLAFISIEIHYNFVTFPLKAENLMEYVIEAQSTEDMTQWLSSIKYCMRFASDGTTEDNE